MPLVQFHAIDSFLVYLYAFVCQSFYAPLSQDRACGSLPATLRQMTSYSTCVWTIYATPEKSLNSHLVISDRNRSASRFCAVKYAHLLTYLVVSFCIQLSEVWLHCVQLFSTNHDPGQYCCDRLCRCQSSPRRDVFSVMFLLFSARAENLGF